MTRFPAPALVGLVGDPSQYLCVSTEFLHQLNKLWGGMTSQYLQTAAPNQDLFSLQSSSCTQSNPTLPCSLMPSAASSTQLEPQRTSQQHLPDLETFMCSSAPLRASSQHAHLPWFAEPYTRHSLIDSEIFDTSVGTGEAALHVVDRQCSQTTLAAQGETCLDSEAMFWDLDDLDMTPILGDLPLGVTTSQMGIWHQGSPHTVYDACSHMSSVNPQHILY